MYFYLSFGLNPTCEDKQVVPFHRCRAWLVEDITAQAHLLWVKVLASAFMATSHPGNYFRDRETEVRRRKPLSLIGGTVGNPLFFSDLSLPRPLTPSQPQMRPNETTPGRTLKSGPPRGRRRALSWVPCHLMGGKFSEYWRQQGHLGTDTSQAYPQALGAVSCVPPMGLSRTQG